jgi:hypothetical protein
VILLSSSKLILKIRLSIATDVGMVYTPAMILRCNKCGSKLAGDARFCPKCGEAVRVNLEHRPDKHSLSRYGFTLLGTIITGFVGSFVLTYVLFNMVWSHDGHFPQTIYLGGTPIDSTGLFFVSLLFVTTCVFGVIGVVKLLARK